MRWSTVAIEGRDLPPFPHAVEEAVAPLHEVARPLLLIDSYERMTALDAHLRRTVLPSLPGRTVVVFAGRRPPDPAWFQGGWETVIWELELGPLPHEDAVSLLRAHGVTGSARVDELVAWAAGSPLALTFAARAAGDPGRGALRRPAQGAVGCAAGPRSVSRGGAGGGPGR